MNVGISQKCIDFNNRQKNGDNFELYFFFQQLSRNFAKND